MQSVATQDFITDKLNFCSFWFYELYFLVFFFYMCFKKMKASVFPRENQIFWCNFRQLNICNNKNSLIQIMILSRSSFSVPAVLSKLSKLISKLYSAFNIISKNITVNCGIADVRHLRCHNWGHVIHKLIKD